MEQIFSFTRFTLLVSKHWVENRKRYSLSILALIGLWIFWFAFGMVLNDEDLKSLTAKEFVYYVSLFIAGVFYSSQYFQELASKTRGTDFLLLPASITEKLLCSILFTMVLFIIVFTAAFFLVNGLAVVISNSFAGINETTGNTSLIDIFNTSILRFTNGATIYSLPFFFSIQSVFLFGSTFFKKFSFIKTLICVLIVYYIVFAVLYFNYSPLFPAGDDAIHLPDWIGGIIRILFMYVIAPFFWVMTYFNLKAKQV